MRVNEVKETRTIEEVVRTEYIADDGIIFRSEDECRKYEESALFVISKELHKITQISQNDINDGLSYDDTVEIFDVKTEKDLENLKRYLYLKARKNGATEDYIKDAFESKDGSRKNYVFDNVTYGHEVLIFWDYEEQWFWVYGNGSIDDYCRFHKDRITKLITPKEESADA